MDQPKIDFAIGGQAVIEGVMMRSPGFVSIAVRKPDGTIVVKNDPFKTLANKIKFLKLPFIRGILNLFEMMVVGMHAINFSATQALLEDTRSEAKRKNDIQPQTKTQKFFESVAFALSFALSLVFALFLFKFIPLLLTTQIEKFYPALKANYFLFNIVDGTIRISIFLGYLMALRLWKYFSRVFEYHGAEHKSVFAYEKGLPLTIENARKQSRFHPRCGTSFIVVVFLISIFIFTFVPRHEIFWINLGRRILVLPIIAAIGYELLKWSAKHQDSQVVRWISAPGLATQRITTKEPDDEELEVALKALKEALGQEESTRAVPVRSLTI